MYSEPIIFHDDDSGSFEFTNSSNEWIVDEDIRWAGGRSTRLSDDGEDSKGRTGTFSFSFDGSGFSITGSVPPSVELKSLVVQVDNDSPYQVPISTTRCSYRPWLAVQGIHTPGRHKVRVSGVPPGVSVDYGTALTRPRDYTQGKTMIIDDQEITFQGSWSSYVPQTWSNEQVSIPYNLDSRQSSVDGDAALVGFVGTTVSILGRQNTKEMITIKFTLDGGIPESVVFPPPSSEGPISTNFPWFSRRDLHHGPHTLRIDLVKLNGDQFNLDYVLYTAGYNIAEERPLLNLSLEPARTVSPALVASIVTILGVCFAFLMVILFLRSKRGLAMQLKIRSAGRPIDLSFELGPLKPNFLSRKAGPNAFAVVPSPSAPQSFQPSPFQIPAEEWESPPVTFAKPRDRKVADDLEAQGALPEPRRPSQTVWQIGELYRAVLLLSEEAQQLRGRLRERTQTGEDAEPPPYVETASPSNNNTLFPSPSSSYHSHPPPHTTEILGPSWLTPLILESSPAPHQPLSPVPPQLPSLPMPTAKRGR